MKQTLYAIRRRGKPTELALWSNSKEQLENRITRVYHQHQALALRDQDATMDEWMKDRERVEVVITPY